MNISRLKNNKYLAVICLKNTNLTAARLEELLSNVTTLVRLNIDGNS